MRPEPVKDGQRRKPLTAAPVDNGDAALPEHLERSRSQAVQDGLEFRLVHFTVGDKIRVELLFLGVDANSMSRALVCGRPFKGRHGVGSSLYRIEQGRVFIPLA